MMTTRPNGLEATEITKSFGGVRALKGVHIALTGGIIHGLVGHNGAGKSTLVNILAGVLSPDEGSIRIDGQEVQLSSPLDALRCGIGAVFQELNLWPNLTVAENICLETDSGWGLSILNRKQMVAEARKALTGIGMTIEATAPIQGVPFADRQLISVARALRMRARVLLLDEPTSALGGSDIDRLAMLLRDVVQSQRVAVLFITHRLQEVLDICDDVTVLRDGEHVTTLPTHAVSSSELVRLMMGPSTTRADAHGKGSARETGLAKSECLLEARGWERNGQEILSTFRLYSGNIVGFLGVPGSGRKEIVESLIGASRHVSVSTLLVNGKRVRRSPRNLYKRKVGAVPGDRNSEGLFPLLAVHKNVGIGAGHIWGVWRFAWRERALTRDLSQKLRIRMDNSRASVRTLSGGNQQKTVLARALAARSQVLIMDEPTRGVDVGSREEIYHIIRRLADDGMAFVIGSSEPEELVRLCSRIFVVHGGEVRAVCAPPYDVNGLMALATGAHILGRERDR